MKYLTILPKINNYICYNRFLNLKKQLYLQLLIFNFFKIQIVNILEEYSRLKFRGTLLNVNFKLNKFT